MVIWHTMEDTAETMDPPQEAHRETFVVRSYESDPRGSLSMESVCHFLQEAARNHASAFGMSVEELQVRNRTWMLSRFSTRMTMYPRTGEELSVMTWPSGIHRLYALRDFRVYDGSRRFVGEAVSAYLVIDVERRRPVRVGELLDGFLPERTHSQIPAALRKLEDFKGGDATRSFDVRYSDLDTNEHVNSMGYVQWVLESVPRDIRASRAPQEVTINYLAELHYGDRVKSHILQDDGDGKQSPCTSFLHRLCAPDGGVVALARTAWREKEGSQ